MEELGRAIEDDGGSVLATYRDPLGGHWQLLAALPIGKVQPTPFQRDLSESHVGRVARAIDKLGRYLDPVIAVPAEDGVYWSPNGFHRLAAMRELGAKSIVALVIPEPEVAHHILLLNTEKAHNLRERALEVVRLAETLALMDERPETEFEGEFEEAEVLRLAATLERGSEHPLAAAIVAGAQDRKLELTDTEDFQSHTGKGVTGKVSGREVALGNHALLEMAGVDASPLHSAADTLRAEGQGVMFVAVDRKLAGLVAVADPIKDSAADAVQALRREGLRLVMMTGDNRRTADAVARRIGGIDEVIAEVLPEQKQAMVEKLRRKGRRVAMAGDGINDAPALAAADVGIAMGTGTDVAMESAAVTLVKGDLSGILRARRLSRAVMRNIRQNLFFSFVFNAAGVPIAAGVLYPSLGLLLNPMIAGAAMAFSSVAVIGNSLRLRSVRL